MLVPIITRPSLSTATVKSEKKNDGIVLLRMQLLYYFGDLINIYLISICNIMRKILYGNITGLALYKKT